MKTIIKFWDIISKYEQTGVKQPRKTPPQFFPVVALYMVLVGFAYTLLVTSYSPKEAENRSTPGAVVPRFAKHIALI